MSIAVKLNVNLQTTTFKIQILQKKKQTTMLAGLLCGYNDSHGGSSLPFLRALNDAADMSYSQHVVAQPATTPKVCNSKFGFTCILRKPAQNSNLLDRTP